MSTTSSFLEIVYCVLNVATYACVHGAVSGLGCLLYSIELGAGGWVG